MPLGRLTPVVLDASALVEYVCRTELGLQVGSIIEEPDTPLHVPDVCDIDFCAGLRGLDGAAAEQALAAYTGLPLIRHEVHSGLARILQLREGFSVYDAAYVALAEHLEATLVTCDGRLTRAVQGLLPLNVVGVT